jgi:hypothetical protein
MIQVSSTRPIYPLPAEIVLLSNDKLRVFPSEHPAMSA